MAPGLVTPAGMSKIYRCKYVYNQKNVKNVFLFMSNCSFLRNVKAVNTDFWSLSFGFDFLTVVVSTGLVLRR